jgi:hypothetical protein
MTDDTIPPPGPDAIAKLAKLLGVGILIEEVSDGPPFRVVATGLVDAEPTRLEGVGETEEDAWRDLARAAIEWKRDDRRNVRFWWGGF